MSSFIHYIQSAVCSKSNFKTWNALYHLCYLYSSNHFICLLSEIIFWDYSFSGTKCQTERSTLKLVVSKQVKNCMMNVALSEWMSWYSLMIWVAITAISKFNFKLVNFNCLWQWPWSNAYKDHKNISSYSLYAYIES